MKTQTTTNETSQEATMANEEQQRQIMAAAYRYGKRAGDACDEPEMDGDWIQFGIRTWDVAKEIDEQTGKSIAAATARFEKGLASALKPWQASIKHISVDHGDKNWFDISIALK